MDDRDPDYYDEFDDDGEDLSPDSARPSALAFRGSIAALLVGTFAAIFLLIRPPEEKSRADVVRDVPTATPTSAITATATPTRQGGAAPSQSPATVATTSPGAGTATAGATAPATAAPSASPVTTATAAAERTYTVRAGDTLSRIAADHNTTVDAIQRLNPAIDAGALQIGTVLKIPPQ